MWKVLFIRFKLTEMIGKIARVTDRGFGFITPETGDKDLFFHANSLQGVAFDQLRESHQVTFEVEDGPKGPNAVNVCLHTTETEAEEVVSETEADTEASDDAGTEGVDATTDESQPEA